MIKVLQIIPSLQDGGGVQNRLMDNYQNIDRNKIRFDFIVHGYDIGSLEKEVIDLGGAVHHVARKRDSILKNIIDIASVIKKGNYDIVQCHMEYASAIPLFFSFVFGIKHRIVHGHVVDVTTPNINSKTNTVLSKLINIFATDFWACSKNAGRWLLKRNRDDLIIIPNAINVEAYKFSKEKRNMIREKFGLKDECAIVNVGRLSKFKNQEFLLDILKVLIDKGVAARLFIAGDGTLRDKLISKCEFMNLSNYVAFLGNRTDIPDVLQGMDVMVHPSFSEGLGNVLIEAQASGLQVFASADVIPEETHITNNIHYISLQEPADTWANNIIKILDNERYDCTSIVRDAGFDCSKQAKKLEATYLNMCKTS